MQNSLNFFVWKHLSDVETGQVTSLLRSKLPGHSDRASHASWDPHVNGDFFVVFVLSCFEKFARIPQMDKLFERKENKDV